jgi:hypothetical protein
VTNGPDDPGDLVPTVDVRAAYGPIVGQRLGADPARIIPCVIASRLPTLIRT